MKYLDEYRDADAVRKAAELIRRACTRPWTLMEICGGQTHSIMRFGLEELLPQEIALVHGPGCPVCVTPVEILDEAMEIAARPEVTFCSFGDMLRVPGSRTDLFGVKSRGGDVRIGTSAPDDISIHGIVMAPHGVFEVDNYSSGSPRGTATLLGGAITDFYGPFGTFSGDSNISGYGRNFVYDARMLSGFTPPYFPYMTNFTSFISGLDSRPVWQEE